MSNSVLNKDAALSRFQVVEGSPTCAPGKCVVCGKVQGTFIDTGWEMDFYGVIYFCSDCFTQGANTLGYLSPQQGELLAQGAQVLQDQLEDVLEKNRELNDLVGALRRHDSISNPVPDVVVDEPEPNRELQVTDPKPAGGSSKAAKSEQRSNEPSDESGHSDLLVDDSIEQLGLHDSI